MNEIKITISNKKDLAKVLQRILDNSEKSINPYSNIYASIKTLVFVLEEL